MDQNPSLNRLPKLPSPRGNTRDSGCPAGCRGRTRGTNDPIHAQLQNALPETELIESINVQDENMAGRMAHINRFCHQNHITPPAANSSSSARSKAKKKRNLYPDRPEGIFQSHRTSPSHPQNVAKINGRVKRLPEKGLEPPQFAFIFAPCLGECRQGWILGWILLSGVRRRKPPNPPRGTP